MVIDIFYKKLTENAIVPNKAHDTDVGYDLFAIEDVKIKPFEIKKVRTGISLEIPNTHWVDINPRSGLAVNSGIHVLAGIIDPSYRNELIVVLVNLKGAEFLSDELDKLYTRLTPNRQFNSFYKDSQDFVIKSGMKIAQMIIKEKIDARFLEKETLSESDRGMKGFGSSDKKE